MTENYINACVRSPLKKCDLEKHGFISFLNDDLFAELGRAYEEDLNQTKHLISRKVKYYKSISYTIVNKDEQIHVKLKMGDIVDVLEDISPLDNASQDSEDTAEIATRISYAQIKAIFYTKKSNFKCHLFY